MKKLLVLFLMLGMASMASAAIVIDVDPAGGNTKVDIMIEADDSLTGYDFLVDVVGDAVMSAPTVMALGSGAWAGPASDVSGLPAAVRVSAGAITAFGGLPIAGEALILSIPLLEGGMEYTINLSAASAAGTIFDGETVPMGLIESVTIPEPMTMTLLGLGGLGLIRRRR